MFYKNKQEIAKTFTIETRDKQPSAPSVPSVPSAPPSDRVDAITLFGQISDQTGTPSPLYKANTDRSKDISFDSVLNDQVISSDKVKLNLT